MAEEEIKDEEGAAPEGEAPAPTPSTTTPEGEAPTPGDDHTPQA